jgi:transposase
MYKDNDICLRKLAIVPKYTAT